MKIIKKNIKKKNYKYIKMALNLTKKKRRKQEKDKKFIKMHCQLTHQKGKLKCGLPATEMACQWTKHDPEFQRNMSSRRQSK